MSKPVRFSGRKFRELLLYVSERSKEDPRYGATKLNKILYYADFGAFRILGAPITGARYRRLHEVPVPIQWIDERNKIVSDQRAHLE
nr:DUF4065 domain-containing protein [Chloroflexota bacterium]